MSPSSRSYVFMRPVEMRMTPEEFAKTLVQPVNIQVECHCRHRQVYGIPRILHFGTPRNPGCCILCRCDEHSPETHGQNLCSPVTPGCGKLCVLPADFRRVVGAYVGAAGTEDPAWEPETEAGKRCWARYLDWLAERHPQETAQSTPRRTRKGAQA